MGTVVGVSVAGALGALARYGLGGWLATRVRGAFPWETLVINVSGSLVLGFLFILFTDRLVAPPPCGRAS